MARLGPAPPEQYVPLFGSDAAFRSQIYAWCPEIAEKFVALGTVLREKHHLTPRLVELVRLRIAFHNQCRSCMAVRYSYDDGQTVFEDQVCSLEKPYEDPDLTEADRAAIAYADKMATNHLDVSDTDFDELKQHYSQAEIMELCFHVAFYVGFGRMAMSLDMIDDLPEGFRTPSEVTPWKQSEVTVVGTWTAR